MFVKGMYLSLFYGLCYEMDISTDMSEEKVSEEINPELNEEEDIRMDNIREEDFRYVYEKGDDMQKIHAMTQG